jgi:DNA-binding transcriptional ArsR family regulator
MIKPYQASADLFKTLAHPARLAILAILRDGEQCVCHMEAMLKLRQAYISQHLKVLKDAEIVSDRRDGWNMYYHVTRPEIFEVTDSMFATTGQLEDIPHTHSPAGTPPAGRGKAACPCPKCHPEDSLIAPGQVILVSE